MEPNKKLPDAVWEKMITFALAGLGFAAALAWNDAIQTLFGAVFGAQNTLIAKFSYAIVVTVIVAMISIKWSKKSS